MRLRIGTWYTLTCAPPAGSPAARVRSHRATSFRLGATAMATTLRTFRVLDRKCIACRSVLYRATCWPTSCLRAARWRGVPQAAYPAAHKLLMGCRAMCWPTSGLRAAGRCAGSQTAYGLQGCVLAQDPDLQPQDPDRSVRIPTFSLRIPTPASGSRPPASGS